MLTALEVPVSAEVAPEMGIVASSIATINVVIKVPFNSQASLAEKPLIFRSLPILTSFGFPPSAVAGNIRCQ
jgi:hypothetical protein